MGGSDHSKKHKRPDDNTFSNLFGPPISKQTPKVSPDSRSTKSSSSNSKFHHQTLPSVQQKPGSEKNDKKHDKKTIVKDKIKQKHSSPHKESKKSDEKLIREDKKLSHSKERDQSRDKSKKNSSPKHSPSNLKSSTQKTEMKHPTMNSSSKKSKKEKKEKNHDKEKERGDKKDDKNSAHKQKILASKEIFKEKQKPNEKILSVQNDLPFDSSKQVLPPVEAIKKTEKHKHKKKDKNKKDESKDKDKKRERSERSSSKSSAINDETADSRSSKSKELKVQQTPLDALMGEISERESSDSETENHIQKQEKNQETPNNYQIGTDLSKSVSHTHSKSEKSSKRSSKEKARSIEKEEKKRKRKNKDEIEHSSSSMDPPKKIYKKEHLDTNSSSTSLDTIKVSPIPDIIEKDLTIDYMSDLKDLQHKIMTLQSNTELQQVVEIIAATGRFEVTSKTFDFDLCALDKDTVQKLQTFFQPS